MTIEQIPIRLQLSTASAPAIAPVDANTGLQPQFWRGQTVAFDLGVFDPDNLGVDLTNIDYLQVSLFESPLAVSALVVKTVDHGAIIPYITWQDWVDGNNQNAQVAFSSTDTDLPLGVTDGQFWLAVTGRTLSGNNLVFGAGYVTVYNPGSVPQSTPNYVTLNEQNNNSGDTLISPGSQLHLEVLTVTGSARTSHVVISVVGLIEGARPKVLLKLPATAGIILQFKSGTLAGSTIFTYTTNGTDLTAVYETFYDGSALQILSKQVPAY